MNERTTYSKVSDKNASEAFLNLHFLFFSRSPQILSADQDASAFKRIIQTVGTYYKLYVRAAAEGIPQDQRDKLIKDGLKADALIDPNDPDRADREYKIISEGYQLNKDHWDYMLGQMRSFTNTLRATHDTLFKGIRKVSTAMGIRTPSQF